MDAVDSFLAMGGYAAFIWPAFGITAVVLVGLAVLSRRSLKSRESTLARLQRQTQRGEPERGDQA